MHSPLVVEIVVVMVVVLVVVRMVVVAAGGVVVVLVTVGSVTKIIHKLYIGNIKLVILSHGLRDYGLTFVSFCIIHKDILHIIIIIHSHA